MGQKCISLVILQVGRLQKTIFTLEHLQDFRMVPLYSLFPFLFFLCVVHLMHPKIILVFGFVACDDNIIDFP
jgi:hypothetical protein